MRWPFVELGEFAVQRGGSIDPKKFPDEVFELYSIPSFDAGAPEVCAGSEIGSSKKCVKPNDVLLSRIVPHIRRTWVVGKKNSYRQIASGEWIVFRGQRVYPKFLKHILLFDTFHAAFMQTVAGVGGSLLRARPADVYKIKIPLPSLSEQKRIAGILDAADALRAKRRESLSLLDKLIQSTFLDMFGDPVMNPMGWKRNLIQETDSLVQIGPFGSLLHKHDYISAGIPLINPKHISNGKIIADTNETVTPEKAKQLKSYELKVGDVVMGRRGEMGRCAVVESKNATMLCGTGSLFIRPNRDIITPLYLSKLLSSQSMKSHIEKIAWGITMPNLNRTKVESLAVPTPPLSIQRRFTAIVESIEKQKARLQAHLSELDTLFASLQQRAFNGEL